MSRQRGQGSTKPGQDVGVHDAVHRPGLERGEASRRGRARGSRRGRRIPGRRAGRAARSARRRGSRCRTRPAPGCAASSAAAIHPCARPDCRTVRAVTGTASARCSSSAAASTCPWRSPGTAPRLVPVSLDRSYSLGTVGGCIIDTVRHAVEGDLLRGGDAALANTVERGLPPGPWVLVRGHAPQRHLGAHRRARPARPRGARRAATWWRAATTTPSTTRARRSPTSTTPSSAPLGGTWSAPPASTPGGSVAGGRDPPWRGRGARRLARPSPPTGPVVWKDPRLCLLLPWWRPLLPAPVATVLVWRHPVAVARSLRSRQGFTVSLGLALWERYNRAALAALAGHASTSCATRSCSPIPRDPARPGPVARHRRRRCRCDAGDEALAAAASSVSARPGPSTAATASVARGRRHRRAPRPPLAGPHDRAARPTPAARARPVDGRRHRPAPRLRGALRPVHAIHPVAAADPVLGRAVRRPAPAPPAPRGDQRGPPAACPARARRPTGPRMLPDHVVDAVSLADARRPGRPTRARCAGSSSRRGQRRAERVHVAGRRRARRSPRPR